MQPFFIVKGKLDESVLEEIKNHFFSLGFKRLINIFMVFFGVMALLFLLLKSALVSGVFFMAVILIYAEKVFGGKYCIRKVLNSIGKTGQSRLEFNMHFYDDFFTVEGKEDKRIRINYLYINRIVETAQCCTLFAKGNMCFPVLKDSIGEGKKNEWLDFLLERNNSIRFQIARKAG